jgi:hypothetical protein
MITVRSVSIPEDLAEHIREQRRLNPRDRQGRGWQSVKYHSQPFSWFSSVYSSVEEQAGTIDSWWFNVNETTEYTNWHAHVNHTTVAVLYVTVPGGSIEFRQGEGAWTETPNAGDLLIFPGSLEHRVQPNPSNDIRISVAFNFKSYS